MDWQQDSILMENTFMGDSTSENYLPRKLPAIHSHSWVTGCMYAVRI